MTGFLIDANLPSKIRCWNGERFSFVNQIDQGWSDSQVWSYAATNELTIVSKDADFSHRIIAGQPPPRIIHIKIGNMRLRDFESFIDSRWDTIRQIFKDHKLVNVFPDRIEGIE